MKFVMNQDMKKSEFKNTHIVTCFSKNLIPISFLDLQVFIQVHALPPKYCACPDKCQQHH